MRVQVISPCGARDALALRKGQMSTEYLLLYRENYTLYCVIFNRLRCIELIGMDALIVRKKSDSVRYSEI